jgi:DNA-binding transcriptional LysR family regulator
MGINVLRLRVFRAVVEHGSFSGAAASLGYTQPAISHHVAKLEQELAVQLLERTPRGLRITPPGEALLRHADAVLARLDDAEREVRAIAGLSAGSISLAAFPSAAATFVPIAISAFRKRHPDVRIDLIESEANVSVQCLLAGDHDLVVSYTYPQIATQLDARLATDLLFSDAMAVAVPKAHALAERERIHLTDLAEEDWITPHESGCREATIQACRMVGFTPRVVSQTDDYMAMQGLVASLIGVAIMPRLVSAIHLHRGIGLRPLTQRHLTLDVSVATRANGYRSPATLEMTRLLKEAVGALSTELPLDRRAAETSRARRKQAV